MNSALLQQKIYGGYKQAALRLGPVNTVYRPAGLVNPLAAALLTLNASFNAEDFKYGKPNKYGSPTWYGLFDGSLTQPGDYLVGPQGVFFIAAQQLTLPILCVDCPRALRMSRTPNTSAVGAVGYGGETNANEVDVFGQANPFIGWPASILIKGRNEAAGTGIPSDTKNAGWQILLPVSMTAQINAGDLLRDDLGRRFAVQAAELTDLGWRLQTTEEHT